MGCLVGSARSKKRTNNYIIRFASGKTLVVKVQHENQDVRMKRRTWPFGLNPTTVANADIKDFPLF